MLRALMTVSGCTLLSRVLGFLRDILIARYVGAGIIADAFFAAFRFPNMFRRIFGEGAFNAAFIPLFGKKEVDQGRESSMKFANNAFSSLFIILGVLTILLIPLMSWIMLAVVPGFKAGYEANGQGIPSDFRVSLNGAEAVYFQFDGGSSRRVLSDLKVIERGDPPAEEVVQEILGGYTPAQGKSTHLASALRTYAEERAEEHEKKGDLQNYAESKSDFVERSVGYVYRDGDWIPDKNGLLIAQLPKDHQYAVLEGKWSADEKTTLSIFRNDPKAFAYATKLSQITFIYLFCMALTAQLSGMVNTLKRFLIPAFAPVLLNIIFLIGLYGLVRFTDHKGEVLAWSVALAGFAQLALLWIYCRKIGLPIRLVRPRLTPSMRRLLVLMLPGILAAGIQQINLLIGGLIASFQQGAISYLYYSDRIYQLPLGMIGIAFGVVLLPEITRLLKKGDEAGASHTIVKGLELSMLVAIPASLALLFIPAEIVSVLFQKGEFTAQDAKQTAMALSGFAYGLPAYVLIKVLQPAYFAREDTKTPMFMAGATVLVNIVFSIILFIYYGHVGIAIATSIAAWVNVILLWCGLRSQLSFKAENAQRLIAVLAASFVMGAALYFSKNALADWLTAGFWKKSSALALLISTGFTSYALAALIFKATSLRELKNGFKRDSA